MSIRGDAVIFTGPGKVEVKKITLPDLDKEDLLVRVCYSGISVGTERWILTGKFQGAKYPLVPGYQSVGWVEKTGKRVKNIKVGNRVFLGFSKVRSNLNSWWGGHSSYGVCNYKSALKIPEGIVSQEVALLVLAAVGFNGVDLPRIKKGDLVVVIGQGMVGQMAAQNARIKGAKVIGSDFIAKRVSLSSRYSTDISLNPKVKNLEKIVKTQKEKGADLVIESTGLAKNINECFDLLSPRGKLSLLGYYPGLSQIDLIKSHLKEVTIYSPDSFTPSRLKKTLSLLKEKKLKIKPLITHEIMAKDAKHAYQLILKNPQDILGMVLRWN